MTPNYALRAAYQWEWSILTPLRLLSSRWRETPAGGEVFNNMGRLAIPGGVELMTLLIITSGAVIGLLVSIAGYEAARYPWTFRQRAIARLLEG